MRNILLLFLFLFSATVANASACSCGSYEFGMYDYFTEGDSDCCTGKQDTRFGTTFTTFVKGPGNTWVVDTIRDVTFSDAVNGCYPNS